MASADILRLQNRLKRQPEAFIEDFLRQQQHFNATVEIFKLEGKQGASRTKEFASLLNFMCQAAPCYKDRCVDLPDQLLHLLETNYEVLDPFLRKTIVQGLILLQNRKLIARLKILPVFFTLFRASDKHLRTLIFNHIVNDIRNVNKKKASPKLNVTLQNFVIKMLKDENVIAAQKSLGVMVELWRRQIWTNDKTVNAIASACFSQNTKLMTGALRFFLGVAPATDDEDGAGDEKAKTVAKEVKMHQVIVASASIVHVKHRKKRERELKRAVKTIKQIKTVECNETKISASAIQLLYDPQQFVERLFGSIRKSTESLELRMLKMNVISRVIGHHKLMLLNFYPYLQKLMLPHQKHVTQLLTFLAQASHELVDPEVLGPCVGTLANQFVTDRSSPAVMAVGLNAIREVCARCPLAMSHDLLGDLAQYKKSKEKGVMMAARSLIALYRNLNPALLAKKDRGKASALMMQAGELSSGDLEYGALKPATDVPGASLLESEGGFAEGEEAWKVETPKIPEEDEDEDEDDEDDDEEPWVDEEEDDDAPAPKKRKKNSDETKAVPELTLPDTGELEAKESKTEGKKAEDEEEDEEEDGDEGDEGDFELEDIQEEEGEGDEEDEEEEEETVSKKERSMSTNSSTLSISSSAASSTAASSDLVPSEGGSVAKTVYPVLCGKCTKTVSMRPIPAGMGDGWQCDSFLHEGDRHMTKSHQYHGCETTEACDWSMCEKCYTGAQQSPSKPNVKRLPISATRILTPKDFERIKQLREQHDKELKTRGKKRSKEDGSRLGDAKESGTLVSEKEIVGWVKKVRKTKQERLAAVAEGREGRPQFGRPKQKGGGTTNEAKRRNKPYLLTRDNEKTRGKKNKTLKSKGTTLTTHIKNLKKRAQNKYRKRTSH